MNSASAITSRARPTAYEPLNHAAAAVPAGADGVIWVPALAGAMAPAAGMLDARAGWFGLTASHRAAVT